MPRKTSSSGSGAGAEAGFNEAAARCRGKHPSDPIAREQLRQASMRPRPDAAENAAQAELPPEPPRASMRLRPDAAEN